MAKFLFSGIVALLAIIFIVQVSSSPCGMPVGCSGMADGLAKAQDIMKGVGGFGGMGGLGGLSKMGDLGSKFGGSKCGC